jgi:threonine aldolase
MFGKEDAAYVVSGVFGNQCSLLTASTAGMEVLVRDKGHVIRYENGSCGLISRLMTRTLDCPEGYITPEILKRVIKKTKSHQVPQAGVLILEFPTFEGIVPPMDQFI